MTLYMPLIAMLILTSVIWFVMMYLRFSGMQNIKDPKTVDTRDKMFAVLKGRSRQVSDNFNNLLEMPVLFYVLLILLIIMNNHDPLLVNLSWIYVAARIVHSVVQCSYNNIMHRFGFYAISVIAFFVMLGITTAQLM